MSQRYCCGVSALASLSFRGHWKLPDSSRLYSSTNPLPSQYRALIRSFRLPQNRNSVLVKGSSRNCCLTRAARPSIPSLRSVRPQAIMTRSAPVKFVSMTSGPAAPSPRQLHPHRCECPLPPRRSERSPHATDG